MTYVLRFEKESKIMISAYNVSIGGSGERYYSGFLFSMKRDWMGLGV